ncbi:hypothetical protein H7U19_10745 [Hyunsoonleella sp. SJ7]|uniref:DUF7486 domain-containing protein n=1 Tax=Hyunsoonleella aquatilis TaxID=2762758 RepID=A0A923HAM8_9FLAO|nr:hypothetical protein [Hyunsoonleella aquatilis]MBC3758884.1 hypothetical protein [Hyunsoonleella aquatilis]
MKTSHHSFVKTTRYLLFLLGFLALSSGCNNSASKENKNNAEKATTETFKDIFWNVKAIRPDGKSIDIKVFDNAGDPFDIKAIQDSDQDNLMDVKAFVGDEILPVKILVSSTQFAPVVAISNAGSAYKLEAVDLDGTRHEVIGVVRFGNVVIMKAITQKGKFYGVKAISPTGELNDIKGIKINFQDREMGLRGHDIYAHVKAMHPSDNEDNFKMPKQNKVKKGVYQNNFKDVIWNIKAVTPDGKNLDVKAFDEQGNAFDVKAVQDSKQHSFMNVRAFVGDVDIPVKIMDSEDEYAPIKAIGGDGTIYDLKAITADNVKLDVRGTSRSGNIVNVKAINENGDLYAVKAFAPDGKLNAVKGIKIFDRKVEMRVQGNPVYAHLKAISQ